MLFILMYLNVLMLYDLNVLMCIPSPSGDTHHCPLITINPMLICYYVFSSTNKLSVGALISALPYFGIFPPRSDSFQLLGYYPNNSVVSGFNLIQGPERKFNLTVTLGQLPLRIVESFVYNNPLLLIVILS